VVSVFDRSFLYGDGLFETVQVCNGIPFRWVDHMRRLEAGAGFLKIRTPFSARDLRSAVEALVSTNQLQSALLRVPLSRGAGLRGYSPKGADRPLLVMTLNAADQTSGKLPRWKVVTSSFRVAANDPLANIKTCNKLPQVLARAEAEAQGADEALLCNTNGEAAEATSSNLFWIERGAVWTPPLASGVLPGITRAAVLELCRRLRVPCGEKPCPRRQLLDADGLFLTLTSRGVVGIGCLDGQELSAPPLVSDIHHAYRGLVEEEARRCSRR
jgi:aminodeoxychorismate lyase